MSLFTVPLSKHRPTNLIFDEVEMNRNVNKYVNHVEGSEWTYQFNRIFIIPGNSFNMKYLIKYLSTTLAQHNRTLPGTSVPKTKTKNNQLISHKIRNETTTSQSSDDDISETVPADTDSEEEEEEEEEENIVDDLLDKLTGREFFKLLNVKPDKRLEMLMHHYHVFNKILENISFEKLSKISLDIKTDISYDIYIEATPNLLLETTTNTQCKMLHRVENNDVLGVLKTCGIIVIDISRDAMALSKGKVMFKLLKKELINLKGKEQVIKSKNKRLIVVISTVMTWTGFVKKRPVSEDDINIRIPNPEFADHYEFELEVLSVNKTEGLKDLMTTIIVWTGLTYGYEQDLFKFAFDGACGNVCYDTFPIPKNPNYIPTIHVANLARLIHQVISECYKLKRHGIFAIETPIITLKQIIIALGKTCDSSIPNSVSLDTFMDHYHIEGLHRQMLSMDIKIKPSINRLWPNFEWYDSKASIIHKMKTLVETYKKEHNIKSLKLLVLGPPASGKTKIARRLAKHYNLIYLEPKEIVQDYIEQIREDLMTLRLEADNPYADTDATDDDDETEKKLDPAVAQKILELDQKLMAMYVSMDNNNGILQETYLIPILKENISRSICSKSGYILDGYPMTLTEANKMFGDLNSNIDVHKLPDLTICLTQKAFTDDYHESNAGGDDVLAKTTRLIFSGVNEVSSSDPDLSYNAPPTSIAARKILKNKNRLKRLGRSKRLVWNKDNYNSILKMLSHYYVPIKMLDSPYAPLDYEYNREELPDKDPSLGHIFHMVTKDIDANRPERDVVTNVNKLSSTVFDETECHVKSEQEILRDKMTLLEEFEKVTDFEHIDGLSSDEYLMKYITPTLTKLMIQVAKVRSKNPVNFLAYMAIQENREGLPDFPGFSKYGVQIQTLLKRMFKMCGYDDNTIDMKPLMELLTVEPTDEKYTKYSEEESALHDVISGKKNLY